MKSFFNIQKEMCNKSENYSVFDDNDRIVISIKKMIKEVLQLEKIEINYKFRIITLCDMGRCTPIKYYLEILAKFSEESDPILIDYSSNSAGTITEISHDEIVKVNDNFRAYIRDDIKFRKYEIIKKYEEAYCLYEKEIISKIVGKNDNKSKPVRL